MKSMRLFNLFVIALFLFALVPAQNVSAAPSLAVPAAPSLTSPSNGLLPIADGWQPTLKWKAVTGATSYDLQIATNSSYSSIVQSTTEFTSALNPVEYHVDLDLAANKKFYWHVRARNAEGIGKWSSSRYFYTRPIAVTEGFVNGPMATDGLTVALLRPTFEWEATENVTKYTINVATDTAFKKIKINKTFTVPASTSVVTYTHTADLAAGTTFYWRVLAVGTYAKSPWSETLTFATPVTPPSVPVQVSPLNKTVTIYNPVLTWKPSTTHNLVPAEYQLQLSTSSKFATLYHDTYGPIADTTFTVPEELPAGKYYWRVRSMDDRGVISNWSKAYYFNTPATVRIQVLDAAIHSLGTIEGLEGVTVGYTGLVDPMTTDEDGYVTIYFAPTGSRKVSLSSEDFLNYSKTQSISAGRFYDLKYDLKRRPIRLDLTWGKLPSDLDVHLWLPQTYYEYHLYPDHKGTTTKLPWAKIDKDVFGLATSKTERITIQNRFPGIYTFAVRHFSLDGNWSTSGARVVFSKLDATGKVWSSTTPITVPTGYPGKWWHVLDIDGATGQLVDDTATNVVQIESPGPYDKFGGTALEPK